VAKAGGLKHTGQTSMNLIVGTPQYLAPECTLGGGRQFDGRADQWSLAVVTYRMLAGWLPFDDSDVLKLLLRVRLKDPIRLQLHAPGLPEHVYRAIEIAMAKRPSDRFDSILDFVRVLHGIRTLHREAAVAPVEPNAAPEKAASAEPPAETRQVASAAGNTQRSASRHKALAAGAATLLCAVMALYVAVRRPHDGTAVGPAPLSRAQANATPLRPPSMLPSSNADASRLPPRCTNGLGPLIDAMLRTLEISNRFTVRRLGSLPVTMPPAAPSTPRRPPDTQFPALRLADSEPRLGPVALHLDS
jgi:serine/threonine protein kinase